MHVHTYNDNAFVYITIIYQYIYLNIYLYKLGESKGHREEAVS